MSNILILLISLTFCCSALAAHVTTSAVPTAQSGVAALPAAYYYHYRAGNYYGTRYHYQRYNRRYYDGYRDYSRYRYNRNDRYWARYYRFHPNIPYQGRKYSPNRYQYARYGQPYTRNYPYYYNRNQNRYRHPQYYQRPYQRVRSYQNRGYYRYHRGRGSGFGLRSPIASHAKGQMQPVYQVVGTDADRGLVTPPTSYQPYFYGQYAHSNHRRSYRASKPRYHGFPRTRKATGNNVFIFSPRKKMWAAYNSKGRLVRTGRASGGKGYCPDVRRACRTPRGVFQVYSKGSPHCRSSKYPLGKGGAPMPYCMFFRKGYAIHGSPDVPNYNASHGCIRVRPAAAAWLSRHFIRIGTTVIVTSY